MFFNKKGFYVILLLNLYDQQMKKIFIFIAIIGFLGSCSKEDNNRTSRVIEIRINLSNSEVYDYTIGRFQGEEDFVEIVVQPLHSEISELIITENLQLAIYKYKPQENFVGEEYVEINSIKYIDQENDGEIEEKIIKLSFNILE